MGTQRRLGRLGLSRQRSRCMSSRRYWSGSRTAGSRWAALAAAAACRTPKASRRAETPTWKPPSSTPSPTASSLVRPARILETSCCFTIDMSVMMMLFILRSLMAEIEEVRHISPTHLATQLETHLCIHFMQSTDKHAVYGGMQAIRPQNSVVCCVEIESSDVIFGCACLQPVRARPRRWWNNLWQLWTAARCGRWSGACRDPPHHRASRCCACARCTCSAAEASRHPPPRAACCRCDPWIYSARGWPLSVDSFGMCLTADTGLRYG